MPFNTTQHVLAIRDANSSPATYTRIAFVGDIGAMGMVATLHDTSSHSTTSGWGSQIPGLRRQKTFPTKVWFDPGNAQHTFESAGGLGYMAEHSEEGPWEFIEHPFDQPEYAKRFFAYISEIGRPVPVDGVLSMDVTFAPTGAPANVDATSITINDPPVS